MGCGCNKKKKAITMESLVASGSDPEVVKSLPKKTASSSFVLGPSGEDRQTMISKLRAEELLKLPFYTVLEPTLIRISSLESSTRVLSSLSDMPGIYTFEDVLNITDEFFTSQSLCGEECLQYLKDAIKALGF